MGRLKTTKEHAKEVKALGRVVLVGAYKGAREKTDYRCLKHKKIYSALPTNILKGRGLLCCKGDSAENDKRRIEAARKYDQRLRKLGHLIRLDEYGKNNRTRILHRCLIHGRSGKTTPSDALRGKGLKCCWEAAQQKEVDRKVTKAALAFEAKLAEKNNNLEWVGGEYCSAKSTLWFFCKTHKEEHPAIPNTVLQGHGLRCCHRANSSEIGKRVGPLHGKQIDNVWRALSETLERTGKTELYLFVSPLETYNKFGISFNSSQRQKEGGYGISLIEPKVYLYREDAVLIEQAFKFSFACDPPDELNEWSGHTELTVLNSEEFEEVITELEEALECLGRWKFAEEFCDPVEVKKARDFLKLKPREYPK